MRRVKEDPQKSYKMYVHDPLISGAAQVATKLSNKETKRRSKAMIIKV